jgi:hypothetical protein
LVLGLFPSASQASAAAGALHASGFTRESISVLARSHAEAAMLARAFDATPGVEMEDSRAAGRIGELGAVMIAAAAVGLPGAGSLVAAGPLAAELGEAAGHLAGGLSHALSRAGLQAPLAEAWQAAVAEGHVLVGVHVSASRAAQVEALLRQHGAESVELARWEGDVA